MRFLGGGLWQGVTQYMYIYIYISPPPRAYQNEGLYHICIFILIFQIVAHAKTTVNFTFFEYAICKRSSIAIICSKKHAVMQDQNPVLHFQKPHPKMTTLCRNSGVHHEKHWENAFFEKNLNFTQDLHKTCAGPRFPRIPMNKVQDSCTGPRFPRFFGNFSFLKVPKISWILGNLEPVHESCILFIGNLGKLGPAQVWWAFSIIEVTWTGPRFPRFLMNKAQGSCAGPRLPIPSFFGTIRQDPGKVPKDLGNLWPVHESCTLFIRIFGNLGPVQIWWASSIIEVTNLAQAQDSKNILMNKVQDSCTGPRFPRIHKIFWNYQVRPRQSSKRSWESLACAWILHFVYQDSWNLGPVQVWWASSIIEVTWTGPRFPRFLMNKAQDSCAGPRLPRIPSFFGNYQARPWQSSKKSWDSWESWACAGFVLRT